MNSSERFAAELAANDAQREASDSLMNQPTLEVDARRLPSVACLRILRELWHGDAAEQLDEPLAAPTVRRLGRFLVQQPLGVGGFGEVFLAFDPQLARQVAVKVLRSDITPSEDTRQRFLRDAHAAARVNHPGIVRVFDVGRTDQQLWIVSEYCAGGTLARWIHGQAKAIPARLAAEFAWQIARSVGCAHEQGILHRDLKPSNVLIADFVDADEPISGQAPETRIPRTLKLADFGLAKLDSDIDLTRSGSILGTPAYMAPEQAQGNLKAIDPRTDVYGIGAILYELLLGRAPFTGEGTLEICRRVVHDEPLAPRQLRSDLPVDLEAIVLRCLEKRRERRYGSAEALADDLRRFLHHEPTVARPPTLVERLAKWVRRHPGRAGLIAVTLVSLVGYIAGAAWHIQRLEAALAVNEELRRAAQDQAERLELERYVSDMSQTQQAWTSGGRQQTLQLLDRYRYGTPGARLRDFAWWHLWRQMHREAWTATTGVPMAAITFSPDGKWLASAGHDGAARLFDADSGRELGRWAAHAGNVNDAAFAPDGQQLVTVGDDGRLCLWRLPQGQLVHTADAHAGDALTVTVSHDGRSVATGGVDGRVRVWSLPRLEPSATIIQHSGWVRCVRFSPDDRRLASGGEGALRVTNLVSGESVVHEVGQNQSALYADFSPTGDRLAVALQFDKVRVFDSEGSRLLANLHHDTHPWCRCVVFVGDGKYLLAADDAGVFRLWDTATWKQISILGAHDAKTWRMAVSGDGQRLASCDDLGAIKMWRTADLLEPNRLDRIPSAIEFVVLPDQDLLVSGSSGLYRWSPRERKQKSATTTHHVVYDSLAFDRRTQRVAASDKGRLYVWDGLDLRQSRQLSGPAEPNGPAVAASELQFHPSRDLLYAISHAGTILEYDVKSGSCLRTVTIPDHRDFNYSSLSSDGRWLVLSSRSSSSAIQVDTESLAFEPILADGRGPVAWIPGTNELVYSLEDGSLAVSAVPTAAIRLRIGNQGSHLFRELAVTPDGRVVAAAGREGPIRLWSVRTGGELLNLDVGAGRIACLRFSADSRMLYVAVSRSDSQDSELLAYGLPSFGPGPGTGTR